MLTVLILAVQAEAADSQRIEVSTGAGAPVMLGPEPLAGIKTRPLRKLKESLDNKFGVNFFSLHRISVPNGVELIGRCSVSTAPLRLTVYEISKGRNDHERKLRVVATGFYAKPGETGEFRTKVEDLEEDLFFVTAEQVETADQLNSHLTYMNTQENTIALRGYSSNWNLSALKLDLAGKDAAQREAPFTKDAMWLVDRLIHPLWVESIRIDVQP
jgi:hypothetical protein